MKPVPGGRTEGVRAGEPGRESPLAGPRPVSPRLGRPPAVWQGASCRLLGEVSTGKNTRPRSRGGQAVARGAFCAALHT